MILWKLNVHERRSWPDLLIWCILGSLSTVCTGWWCTTLKTLSRWCWETDGCSIESWTTAVQEGFTLLVHLHLSCTALKVILKSPSAVSSGAPTNINPHAAGARFQLQLRTGSFTTVTSFATRQQYKCTEPARPCFLVWIYFLCLIYKKQWNNYHNYHSLCVRDLRKIVC